MDRRSIQAKPAKIDFQIIFSKNMNLLARKSTKNIVKLPPAK